MSKYQLSPSFRWRKSRNWTKKIRHGKLQRLSFFVETNQASCFFCPTKSQETDGWGKKTLQRLAADLKNEYPERKGFSVRNMQCMMQFYNEYNKELNMAKVRNIPITQSMIAQLGNAPIELPIKHLSWSHNIILIQKVWWEERYGERRNSFTS